MLHFTNKTKTRSVCSTDSLHAAAKSGSAGSCAMIHGSVYSIHALNATDQKANHTAPILNYGWQGDRRNLPQASPKNSPTFSSTSCLVWQSVNGCMQISIRLFATHSSPLSTQQSPYSPFAVKRQSAVEDKTKPSCSKAARLYNRS